jgi:hypothetical protein
VNTPRQENSEEALIRLGQGDYVRDIHPAEVDRSLGCGVLIVLAMVFFFLLLIGGIL